MIKIRFGSLVSEDVLKMVCAKGAAILPLRVAEAIPFPNGNPAISADRLSGSGVRLFEPRDHERSFRFKLHVRHIIIWQCDVERILPRDESYWNVISACARLWTVCAAVIRGPIEIPATLVVRHRIISASFFTHPEHRRDDIRFPRVTLDRRA